MGDLRNMKTCLFKARISSLFERETPFFVFDVETRLDNLVGSVLSEGRYLQINEKSFEFLANGGAGGSGKRVQLYQMLKRALPHDPHLIVTASKKVFFNPPFNLRIPEVPMSCITPVWCTQSPDVSLVNINAFERVVNHYAKKVVAFGASLNPPRSSGMQSTIATSF